MNKRITNGLKRQKLIFWDNPKLRRMEVYLPDGTRIRNLDKVSVEYVSPTTITRDGLVRSTMDDTATVTMTFVHVNAVIATQKPVKRRR